MSINQSIKINQLIIQLINKPPKNSFDQSKKIRRLCHIAGDMNQMIIPNQCNLCYTLFKIRAMSVQGRACNLSVTEAPHNTEYLRVEEEDIFCLFKA